MAKGKQMLYLERQVTKLKRELAAAKRAQRVAEHAVQQYKGRAELAQAQTSDYAQRLEEQYDEVTIP
jgi:predicted  nucleic acid-binding Zn-ribbon protein